MADKKEDNKTKDKNFKVISEHIAKIDKSLSEKKIYSFWTFADRSGFKKIKNMSFKEMQKSMKADIDKYKNRQVCEIKIMTMDKPDKYGSWLVVGIWAITTDKEANMEGKGVKNNGCSFKWTENDFKITRFSLKLVEAIMHVIADGKHSCSSFTGFHIEKVIKDLKEKKIDLSEHLKPLAGLV